MHLDDERLQRLIDGELAGAGEAAVREHLARCPECAARLGAAMREEGDVRELLDTLDGAAPRAPLPDFAAIVRRAEARRPRLARWAAGIALVVGLAGIAYAFPGSPLPRWMNALVSWGTGRSAPRAAAPAPGFSEAEPSSSGIGVPAGSRLLILFTPPNPAAEVVVRLTDGSGVEVRVPRDAAAFETQDERLVVRDHGTAATYEVDVPRAAPRVEIIVGVARRFLKDGDVVTAPTPASASGAYRFSLAP